jgi:hypothetical protein|nr:MAG TPA: hypothetical protein [Caudoviricetes sp.]
MNYPGVEDNKRSDTTVGKFGNTLKYKKVKQSLRLRYLRCKMLIFNILFVSLHIKNNNLNNKSNEYY